MNSVLWHSLLSTSLAMYKHNQVPVLSAFLTLYGLTVHACNNRNGHHVRQDLHRTTIVYYHWYKHRLTGYQHHTHTDDKVDRFAAVDNVLHLLSLISNHICKQPA